MRTAIGTKITTKAIVSSLMPMTAPKKLKQSMMRVTMILSTPSHRIALTPSTLLESRKNSAMATSRARLSLSIQKAPPIVRM